MKIIQGKFLGKYFTEQIITKYTIFINLKGSKGFQEQLSRFMNLKCININK